MQHEELAKHFITVTKLIPLATRRSNRAAFEPLLDHFKLSAGLLEDQRVRRTDLGDVSHWEHKRRTFPRYNVRFLSLGEVGDMTLADAAKYVGKTPSSLRTIIAVRKKYSVLMPDPVSKAEDIVIVTKISNDAK